LAVYEVGEWYATLIAAAARRGVDVRVVVDGGDDHNSDATKLIQQAGVAVHVCGGQPEKRMHAKLLLIDDQVALGTGNLINRDAPATGKPGTREWWVAVSGDHHLVDQAAQTFAGIWQVSAAASIGPSLGAQDIPPVHVPDVEVAPSQFEVSSDALSLLSSAQEVYEAIQLGVRSSTSRFWVTVPYVHGEVATVKAILNGMDVITRRGVDVRLLLGESQAASQISGHGFPVRVMDPSRSTTGHAKGVVADDVVIVSSCNWSLAGFTSNWEAGVAVRDHRAAEYFAQAFSRDWISGTQKPTGGRS
jgi:phosphatidylserine/phosphatidylglycerophosphate/cardiolipin synthase-like enzyme